MIFFLFYPNFIRGRCYIPIAKAYFMAVSGLSPALLRSVTKEEKEFGYESEYERNI